MGRGFGLGGLGAITVRLAKAMGADVTAFTTTQVKVFEARKLGAKGILENDRDTLGTLANRFDFILSTIPEKRKVDAFVPFPKRDATYCAVGAPAQIPGYNNQQLVMQRERLAGSLIGSIRETQEVLDFRAEHGIAPDVEAIPIQGVNDAYKRVKSGDVRFRYVIDMASLKREMADAA